MSMTRTDGMALLVTMMACLVLVALVGALVPLASTEVSVASNHRRAIEGLYAAEAALEWTVAELASNQARVSWHGVLGGAVRSRFWGTSLQPRLADGSRLSLPDETARLRRDGSGEYGAGRGLAWRLFAHGSLSGIVTVPAGYPEWMLAVWVAVDAADADGDPQRDSNDAVVAHAAAFGPARAHRALQATLVRVVPAEPPSGAPVRDYVQLLSWGVVR